MPIRNTVSFLLPVEDIDGQECPRYAGRFSIKFQVNGVPSGAGPIRQRNFGYPQRPASPDPALEIRLFDILRLSIFCGFFLLSRKKA